MSHYAARELESGRMPSNRPLKLGDIRKPDLAEGDNPFADRAQEDEGSIHAPADYRGAYEVARAPWGSRLFALSGIACLGSLIASVPFWLGEWASLPAVLGGLSAWIIGLPTFLYALLELKGIRLGAIEPHQRRRTQAACLLAIASLFWTAWQIFRLLAPGF